MTWIHSQSLVSIILPTFNAALTIAEAIESVLAQTHANWELIIVENGSTDATMDICRLFIDSRISLIRHPQSGLSRARNIGLDKARGEYVCFLDADDLLPPRSLEVRLLRFTQKAGLHYCDGQVIKKNESLDKIIDLWQPKIPTHLSYEMNKIDSACFCGVTWMILSESIKNIRFDESWSHLEDRKFFFELAQNGSYDFVNETIYVIRKREGSLMTNHYKLQMAYRRFMEFIRTEGQLTRADMEIQKKCYRHMFFKTHLRSGRIVAAVRVLLER